MSTMGPRKDPARASLTADELAAQEDRQRTRGKRHPDARGPVKGWTVELTAYPNGRPVWIAELKGDKPTRFYEGPSAYNVMGAIAGDVDREAGGLE